MSAVPPSDPFITAMAPAGVSGLLAVVSVFSTRTQLQALSGENFDRQASLRRSLIYTDTLVRRPKKVKRRKTITGVPDNIQKELGMAHQNRNLLPLVAAQHPYANLHCVLVKWMCSDSPNGASGANLNTHEDG
uniref:Uncharacterized protein n=1 Tax=Equus caballus TaxID=9796 RepID=A0A9L0RC91_HORSE